LLWAFWGQSFKIYFGGWGEVAQIMYTHVSKCKNDIYVYIDIIDIERSICPGWP
jgi:hypothetical protein